MVSLSHRNFTRLYFFLFTIALLFKVKFLASQLDFASAVVYFEKSDSSPILIKSAYFVLFICMFLIIFFDKKIFQVGLLLSYLFLLYLTVNSSFNPYLQIPSLWVFAGLVLWGESEQWITWSRTLILTTYTLAGLSKLFYLGTDWFLTDHLRILFFQSQMTRALELPAALELGSYLSQFPELCKALALLVLLLELSALLALFKKFRFLYFFSFLLFHSIALLTLHIFHLQGFLNLLFLAPIAIVSSQRTSNRNI